MKKIILSALCALTCSIYADQLSVIVMPNVTFDFTNAVPSEVSMMTSVGTIAEGVSTGRIIPFSQFSNSAINNMQPLKGLMGLNKYLHPFSFFNILTFGFTLSDPDSNTIYATCNVNRPVPEFLSNVNYTLVITGPQRDQCFLSVG